MPKTHKYTLGQRIDSLFIEIIESVFSATFLKTKEKLPFVRKAIQKLDTVNLLLLILWETKSFDNKKYVALAKPLDEIGKMLGGWNGQIEKTLLSKKESK